MAISGQQHINIGAENTQTGSDSLYTAFNKVENNFTKLFGNASNFNTYVDGAGISTGLDTINGILTITNTGVTSITAGTGIAISSQTGNVIISASGNGNVGVTSIAMTSNTLDVTGGTIVSAGTFTVDLPTIPTSNVFAPGDYVAPSVTVDETGRITAIANTVSVGTVTSVALEVVGDGLSVSNSPVTSSGVMTITNTGVTKINQGRGILLSGTTGEITISTSSLGSGSVTLVEVYSNSLNVTGSPVTTTGNIVIELPDDITVSGNITANAFIGDGSQLTGITATTATKAGTVTTNAQPNITSVGSLTGLTLTANSNVTLSGSLSQITGSNLLSATYLTGTLTTAAQPNITSVGSLSSLTVTGNISAGNITGASYVAGTLTTAAQPNITSTGTLTSLTVSGNISANNATLTNNLTIGNSTVGTATSYDFVAGNTVTISNTGYLLLNTVTNNNKFVGFQAPNSITPSYIVWQLPNEDGTANSFLKTDGAGTLSFGTPAISSAPGSNSATGTPGQIAFDSGYVYVCVATNTWKRAALTTWP